MASDNRDVWGPYWNGEKSVFCDPFKAISLLWVVTDGRLQELIGHYNSDNPTARADASIKLAEASRRAFGLADIDVDTGEGVNQEYALSVLKDFLVWTNQKK